MKKNLSLITIFLSVLLLIFGCAARTSLKDYQPLSVEEKEVVNFMKECDEAYQDRNMTKWLDCFHDNAGIKVWIPNMYPNFPIYSKLQYENYLGGSGAVRMEGTGAARMTWNIVDPKIILKGNTATMKCRNVEDEDFPMTFDMVNEENQWRITRFDWHF